MLQLDVSRDNLLLYEGMDDGAKPEVMTLEQYAQTIGGNVRRFLGTYTGGWDQVTLTGDTDPVAWLVVFHNVLHRFDKVVYRDGEQEVFLSAMDRP